MKKGLIIGLAATSVAAAVSSLVSVGVSAGPLRDPGPSAADNQSGQTLPASQIAAGVRAAGLDPNGEPVLRGRYYVLHAFDPHGHEMRVLADAQFGGILSILPSRRASAYRPSYGGVARIIHVPQPDDAVAGADYRDNVDIGNVNTNYDQPKPSEAPPAHDVRPAPRPRSEAPRIKRHIVSSAPPPPPQAGNAEKDNDKALSPVYPTPDFGVKIEPGEKFDPQPRQD
jgi:hypothetical protein